MICEPCLDTDLR